MATIEDSVQMFNGATTVLRSVNTSLSMVMPTTWTDIWTGAVSKVIKGIQALLGLGATDKIRLKVLVL